MNLQARRLALGLTQHALAEVAGLKHSGAQSRVSLAESSMRGTPTTALLDATLTRIEAAQRALRQRAAMGAAVEAAGEAGARLQAAMAGRALDLLRDGDGEAFDVLGEWLPAEMVEAIGSRFLDEIEAPAPALGIAGEPPCTEPAPSGMSTATS